MSEQITNKTVGPEVRTFPDGTVTRLAEFDCHKCGERNHYVEVNTIPNPWQHPITVSERLPEYQQEVLCWNGHRFYVAWMRDKANGLEGWWQCDSGLVSAADQPTHWLQLPPKPG